MSVVRLLLVVLLALVATVVAVYLAAAQWGLSASWGGDASLLIFSALPIGVGAMAAAVAGGRRAWLVLVVFALSTIAGCLVAAHLGGQEHDRSVAHTCC